MTVKEILAFERDNTGSILLLKEGVFWKAYERSAYLFCKHIQPYKLKKKFIKKVQTDMVSLGFPDGVLQGILDEYAVKLLPPFTQQPICCKAKGL